MTTFYIIRHGESKSNAAHAEGRKVMSADFWGTDLTENGVKQAARLAQELRHVHFDAAFSSDLLRAKRTAEIIALEHKLAVTTNETIRECNANSFHHLDPQKQEEMKKLISNLEEEEKVAFKVGEEMENYEQGASRLILFLRDLAIVYEGKTIAIVAHGTLMRAFLIKLGFATYDELPSGSISNTGYVIIENDESTFEIVHAQGIQKKRASQQLVFFPTLAAVDLFPAVIN